MKHAFISYVSENWTEVKKIYDVLKSHDIEVWVDRNNIDPGLRWKDAIRKAIREGAFFIACFSKEYNKRSKTDKTYMNEELTIAIEELRQRDTEYSWFIPVKVNNCKIPDRNIGGGETLNDLQHVKLYKDWDAGIQRIIKLMRPEFSEPIVNGDIPETIKPLKLFIAYAHKDTEAKDELITRLAVLQQQGLIDLWHDNQIIPGDKWHDVIFDNLAESDIQLYLTSAFSLASANCNKELAAAFNANIRIIPILLENCDWRSDQQISELKVLPNNTVPITEWDDQSKGWQNVVDGIREVIHKMQSQVFASSEEDTLLEWLFQQGKFLMMVKQVDKAIEAYSHVIKRAPFNTDAYNNRGDAYHNRSEFDLAIADYDKAIELDPDFHSPYNNRGNAYRNKRQFNRAINDYNMAIELDPKHPYPYNGRGNAYRDIGELDQAITDYTKAIELDPDYHTPYNSLGEVYRYKEEFDRALENYTKAIERKPDYSIAYSNRGIIYRRIGKYDLAIEDYTKAIKLEPNLPWPYNNRGNVYLDKEEFDQALRNYNKAIELKPDYAEAYNNRGETYHKQHQFYQAITDYSKAIELKPDYGNAYRNRGLAWLHLQEWEKAETDLTTSRNIGFKIIPSFHNDYESVEDFEQKTGIQLPPDIAEMLTQ